MTKEIYIIHGWTYTIEPWTSVVSLLKSRGIVVHQLRVPGLTSPSDKVWDVADYVEWLHGELKGVDNPVVLGHSNGGRILLHYLKKYPGSIKTLILLNAAGINVDNERTSFKRSFFQTAAAIFRPLKKIPFLRKVIYRLIGGSDYDRAPENMKKTLSNMLKSDATLTISDIPTETVVLWGEDDRITPLSQGKKMATELPHAMFHQFSGWDHAPYITHPNQLAKVIEGILS